MSGLITELKKDMMDHLAGIPSVPPEMRQVIIDKYLDHLYHYHHTVKLSDVVEEVLCQM